MTACHSPSFDLLESLGVPAELVGRLRALVAHGIGEETLVRVFVALLARSPAGSSLTPEQRSVLEGNAFGDRELRSARVVVQPLLAGVTEDSWCMAVGVG